MTPVHVYSAVEEAELWVNGVSMGRRLRKKEKSTGFGGMMSDIGRGRRRLLPLRMGKDGIAW